MKKVGKKMFSTINLDAAGADVEHQNENVIMPFQIPASPFCIYGAGIVATGLYTAMKSLYRKTPLFFLVSDPAEGKQDENPPEIDGIPVKRLSDWRQELRTQDFPLYYLVAAPETHHAAITASLHTLQIEDSRIVLFTGELENRFLEAYYGSRPDCRTVERLLEDGGKRAQAPGIYPEVFQAKCHVDRPLQNPVQAPLYVVPIQVGAALTEQIVSGLRDDTGENISCKNRNYCELTAAYYAWKNSDAAYKGLCHYRRIFDITDEQMRSLLVIPEEWDVILPYPSVHYPNISAQHLRYIKEADWKAMLRALEETAPDYDRAYRQMVENGEQHFFNFNMLIAKAEVFDDYCDFLFSVLSRAEEFTTPEGRERADRFAGYMGENLTTLYFQKNKDKLKIVYAGKRWLT